MDLFECIVDDQIFAVEADFQRHVTALNLEIDKQFVLSNNMWDIATRFLGAGPFLDLDKDTPYSRTTKQALLDCEKFRLEIMKSMDDIAASLAKIEGHIALLDKRLKMLSNTDIRFIRKPALYEPYSHVRGIIADLFEYYQKIYNIQKQFAELIQPTDAGSLMDYRLLLQPKIRYELLIEKLTAVSGGLKNKNYECIVSTVDIDEE